MTSLATALAEPFELYDAFMRPHSEGYLGADGALSIPLSETRILWIYGDTLIGSLGPEGRHYTAMPRNSIGIHDISDGHPGSIEFLWNDREGKPASFFEHPDGDDQRWLWGGTGFLYAGEVYVFCYRVTHGTGPMPALAFSVEGITLLRLHNPHDHPRQWQWSLRDLDPAMGHHGFSSAHFMQDGMLHLFGGAPKCTREKWHEGLYLARIPLDALASEDILSHFEYWSSAGRWSQSMEDLEPVLPIGVAECDVYYDAPRGRYLCTVYPTRTAEFLMAEAPELTGPWGEPRLIYESPQHAANPDELLSYTNRMHPELNPSADELVMTYAVNGRGTQIVLRDAELYYPRFIKLDLTRF